MISNLPKHLLDEILSRIPDTSLKRITSTCKRWNTLFKDQGFTNNQFYKAAKQYHILALKEVRVCSVSENINIASPSIEFKGTLILKDSHSNLEEVNIDEVFHCDGLLLRTTKDDRLVFWNPCLGESRWIQPKTGYKISRFALGCEINKSSRSYKILIR